MYWSTTIIQEAPDRLSKREWRFTLLNELDICLDSIWDYKRPNTRHKYRYYDKWGSIDHREDTMPRIEPPEYVKEEVRKRILAELTFV